MVVSRVRREITKASENENEHGNPMFLVFLVNVDLYLTSCQVFFFFFFKSAPRNNLSVNVLDQTKGITKSRGCSDVSWQKRSGLSRISVTSLYERIVSQPLIARKLSAQKEKRTTTESGVVGKTLFRSYVNACYAGYTPSPRPREMHARRSPSASMTGEIFRFHKLFYDQHWTDLTQFLVKLIIII